MTFDSYGTLNHWESGLPAALAPLRAASGTLDDDVPSAFSRLESRQAALISAMPCTDLLAAVHGRLVAEWGVPHDPAANTAGLASAWIDRRHAAGGWGTTEPVAGDVREDVCFTSLAELTAAHAAERV